MSAICMFSAVIFSLQAYIYPSPNAQAPRPRNHIQGRGCLPENLFLYNLKLQYLLTIEAAVYSGNAAYGDLRCSFLRIVLVRSRYNLNVCILTAKSVGTCVVVRIIRTDIFIDIFINLSCRNLSFLNLY